MSKICKKNLLIFTLVITLILSLCACGKKDEEPAVPEAAEISNETTQEETVEPEPEPEVKTKIIKRIAKEEKTASYSYEYEYDDQGTLVAKKDSSGNLFYKYEYNDQNLVSREMKLDNYFEQPYFYDEWDMSYDTVMGEAEFDVSEDQMKMIEEGYTRYTEYEYDKDGNKITEIEYGIDVYAFLFPLTFEVIDSHRYEYNSDGTLAKVRWCAREPETPVWDYILIYDDNGTNIGLQVAASDDGKISREYEYELDDKGNILTGYDLEDYHDCTYTYDNDGNILTKTSEEYDFYEDFADEKAFSYYNLDTYEYDEDGLLISHRYQMVPTTDVDEDYDFYVKDETTTYTYEEIEVEISEEEAAEIEAAKSDSSNEEPVTEEVLQEESLKKNVDDKLYELFSCVHINGKSWLDWKYEDDILKDFPELEDTNLGKDSMDLTVSKEGNHEGCPVWYYESNQNGGSKDIYVYYQEGDREFLSARINVDKRGAMINADYSSKYKSSPYADGFQKFMSDNGLESAEDIASYVGVDIEELKEQKELSFETSEFGTMKVKYVDDNPKYVTLRFEELSNYPEVYNFYISNSNYGEPSVDLTITQMR